MSYSNSHIFLNSIDFTEKPARPIDPVVSEKPCVPSPCGPNSQCREVGNVPACSCLSGFLGVPPECRPECITNAECPPAQACVNSKCQNPCQGTCGLNSECRVVNHNPVCTCPQGWVGDPFTECQIIPSKHGSLSLTLKQFVI